MHAVITSIYSMQVRQVITVESPDITTEYRQELRIGFPALIDFLISMFILYIESIFSGWKMVKTTVLVPENAKLWLFLGLENTNQ